MRSAWLGVLALSVLLAGCLGVSARDNVLEPAVAMSWTGVKEDIVRGPVEAPDTLAAFDSAVRGGDRAVLAGLVPTIWPGLLVVAEQNINAAELSEGVKGSRRERLIQFDLAIRKLTERLD